jgi:hypothetical protein
MARVFISHRSDDTAEAKALANDLRTAGHDVWLDVWQIQPGDSIPGKMDEGLGKSNALVLCLSAKGIHSPWMSREWLSGLARQLNGAGVRLFPVRLSAGDPPAILADIKYADFAANYARALNELLDALRSVP